VIADNKISPTENKKETFIVTPGTGLIKKHRLFLSRSAAFKYAFIG